jgi:hypothetical protein
MARVKVTMLEDYVQIVDGAEGFDLEAALLNIESPGQWVIIPDAEGGHFASRAGNIVSIYREGNGDS